MLKQASLRPQKAAIGRALRLRPTFYEGVRFFYDGSVEEPLSLAVIPLKAKKAVDRNRLKRRARAAFCEARPFLPQQGVLVVMVPVELNTKPFKAIITIFKEAQIQKGKKVAN